MGCLIWTVLLIALLGQVSGVSHVLSMQKQWRTLKDEAPVEFKISNSQGLVFGGIGGLSGGGATSRLLVNYPEEYRSQILDYLFKPGFGASLQILKVEIGGDAQSTDGSESSHRHTENEAPNFKRGYEWWLMKEAKARNSGIQLAALAWGWPGWVGQGTVWPYNNYTKAADYIITWIKGMKTVHDLTIDYVGIWNERPYNAGYIKHLRKALNSSGLENVKIVAADGEWKIAEEMMRDQELRDSVDIIGAHYPGTTSTSQAVQTSKTLWASEDYSTFNNNIGAGCWARILNQNYINGNMTSTISWNLIASYYDDLPFKRCSLMTANEPWSGHYEVPAVLWITAHTTQFAFPGWRYLNSSALLPKGGSFVALTDFKSIELTIIIETMSHDNSVCIRPPLPSFTVEPQNVTFVLDGLYKQTITKFSVTTTLLGKSASEENTFVSSSVDVVDGKVTIFMEPDKIVTLSSLGAGQKGSYGTPPASAPFPLPYSDNFDNADGFSEAHNFADQSGVFELFQNLSSKDGHQNTMRQVVPMRPLTWCDDSDSPITVIGNYLWSDVNVTVDVNLENSPGVFVAMRVDSGGCTVRNAKGLFLWLKKDMQWKLTTTLERTEYFSRCHEDWKCWDKVRYQFKQSGWNTLSIAVYDNHVYGYLNSVLLFKKSLSDLHNVPSNGWAAFGVQSFSYAQFDNFSVRKAG